MTLNLVEIPQQGGGWFKPKEYPDHVAMLVEVTSFERQRPTPNGPKDSALCDITVFDEAALNGQGDPLVLKGTRVEQTVLARDLSQLAGQATVTSVVQIPSKKPGQHPAWVWRNVSRDVQGKVVAWAEAREEAVEAALADAPSFD